MNRFIIVSLLFMLMSICFMQCSKPTDVTGNSSQTGNAFVSGYLYNASGPAVGAKVSFVKVNYNPYTKALGKMAAITDTAITDASGKYDANIADTGTYNVYAAGTDGTLSLINSVTITGDTQVVPSDTLKAPASLAGHIKLQPGDEPDKIIAIAMGSNTFSLISTAAQFSFANLAEGHYAVKFFSTLDNYSNYDTTFTIVAGTNVSMPDSIKLPLKIPIPTGFAIKYDTLKQIATLSWNRMNPAKVKGYNLYRQHLDSAEVKLNAQARADTFYVDSTGIQDQTYVYSVVAVDFENKEGIRSLGDTLTIKGFLTVIDSIVKGYTQGVDGNFGGIARGVVDNSGNYYIVDNINKWLQKIDSSGNFILKVDLFSMPVAIANYLDSFLFVCDRNAKKIVKTDLNGVVDTAFSTIGSPSGVCTRGDSIFVSSDSGIIIHDLNGNQLNVLRHSFSIALSKPNVIALNNGKLYAIEDRGAFEIDLQAQAVKNIWNFSNQHANQQAMICQYNEDTLAIVTSGGNAPFFSSLYLINTSGNLIAECKLRYGIGGIIKSSANLLIGFSGDGKIITFTR